MATNREIAIVFDGPPGPEAGRFVEVEVDGASVGLGRWESVDGGRLWELRFTAEEVDAATGPPKVWLDHVYNGPAVRVLDTHSEYPLARETITGAFHVLYRDERCALLDNGEGGTAHGRWLVTTLDQLVKP